jgi:very-short-patch-repair endonuclease
VITPGNRRLLHEVRAVAADQGGVVGRDRLVELGASPSAIDRALRSGWLHRLYRGVYSVVTPEVLGDDSRLLAALMAAGPGAFISHGTAAWRWGLIPAPGVMTEVSAPHGRRSTGNLVVHRHGVLRPGDVVWNGRFRSTSVARTLLDLGVRYPLHALARALAEAEFGHDLRPADVLHVLRRGHPGSANLRAALDAHAPGHGEARSQLERKFRALLVHHQIELPERNQRIGPWIVDCVWPDRRVVVELDGRQHSRPHQADRDDDRDLWLRRSRFVPRRYGPKQVYQQPGGVITDLLEAFGDAVKLGYAAAT